MQFLKFFVAFFLRRVKKNLYTPAEFLKPIFLKKQSNHFVISISNLPKHPSREKPEINLYVFTRKIAKKRQKERNINKSIIVLILPTKYLNLL